MRKILFYILLLVSNTIFAQDGWQDIRNNDYHSAREKFTAVLSKDSVNESALKGMIYLSETQGDDISYSKYINTLVNNHWNENYYLLFNDDYKGDAGKVISQSSLSVRAKMDAELSQADKNYYHRKFDESAKVYNKLFGNYQWTYIGPFKNLEGSGYLTRFDVETEAYDPVKNYKDEDGDEFHWVNPPARDNSEPVNFRDFLMYSSSAVYFANLFFDLPEARKIQLRLSRHDPVKMWLDGNLVYENNDNTAFEWDNEIVTVNAEAGTHRLLVKLADYSKSNNPYSDLFGNFDMDDYFSSYYGGRDGTGSGFNLKSRNSGGDFIVRITDENGNLYQDIKTSATGTEKKAVYTPETNQFFVLNYFRDQVKQHGDPFDYFAYALACEKYKYTSQGEETFVKYLRANKDLVLAKYLAYKIYFDNSKKEKAYEAMSGIDQDKTPIFDLLYQKLQEIDKVNDEDKYLFALDNLNKLSPSSMKIIKRYVEYYDKKGMTEKKEDYVKDIIKKYPQYEYQLKNEIKQNLSEKKKQKKEDLKEEKGRSYSKDLKKTKKWVKDYFYTQDYYDLMDFYTTKDQNANVMGLYDELIRIQPYNSEHLYSEAKYLFEEEKYDQCITELEKAVQYKPYKASYYELIGDAYYEKKEKDKALEQFKKAALYSSSSSIQFKIEKIEGQRQLKKLFKTPSFDDILAKESEWKEKYKDEESVVLMYTKDQVLTPDHETEIYQKIMVKILTDAGTKKWIEYDFGFMGSIKLSKIIKSNGAEVIPDGSGGYKVFKNLEAGDIIEMEGKSIYSLAMNTLANEYYSRTYLNFEAPVYYEKYELAVPQGQFVNFAPHRVDSTMKKSTDKDYDLYRWEFHDIPEVAIEDAEIDKMDKWASIMVSTMPDWSKLVTWYQRKTYRKLEATYEVKEVLDSIIKPNMSDKDKVETIYNYLTRGIKYSFVSFLQSGYIPKDPAQTICSRIGDCKDVATLMVTMLREVGIESYLVLVKTNDYFHMKVLPSIYFNHCIAAYYLDGKLNFLDMTTDYYPYYILPKMDADAWALLIKDGTTQLMQLPKDNIDSVKNKAEFTIDAVLNPDRSTDLKVSAVHRGALGGSIREHLTQSNKDEQKNYIIGMLGKGLFDNMNLEDYKFGNLEEISSPLNSEYSINAFNYMDRVASMLVFRLPYMTPVNTNPAILTKKRSTSLEVNEIVSEEPTLQKVNLTFPPGYELLEMPKDVNIEGKFGTYRVTFKKTKSGLYVEKFQSFNQSVIDVQDFQAFKDYYQKILDIDSTKIALKKKA